MEFAFVNDDRFVWARFWGQWTVEKLDVVPGAILAEGEKRSKDSLLTDFMGVGNGQVSFFDRVRLGLGVLKLKDRVKKVAVAGPSRLIDRERFGERLARNRGINLLVFSDLEEAQRWLGEAP